MAGNFKGYIGTYLPAVGYAQERYTYPDGYAYQGSWAATVQPNRQAAAAEALSQLQEMQQQLNSGGLPPTTAPACLQAVIGTPSRMEEEMSHSIPPIILSVLRPLHRSASLQCSMEEDRGALSPSGSSAARENEAAGQLRLMHLRKVDAWMRSSMGRISFLNSYPNGLSKQLDPERAEYMSALAVIEKRWNVENRKRNRPNIYLVDWTYLPPDIDALNRLQFSNDSKFASGVQSYFASIQNRLHIDQEAESGRRKELVIFRDYEIGWCLRAATPFNEDELVSVYVGEIRPEQTSLGRTAAYDYKLDFEVPRPNGESRPFYMNAYRIGNESRMFSHHCTPNVYSDTAVVTSAGLLHHTVIFRANRAIEAGEELGIDYLPGRTLADGVDISSLFEECRCAGEDCRFSAEQIAEHTGKKKSEKKVHQVHDVSDDE